MAIRKLALVVDATPHTRAMGDVERVFEHWVFMLGRNPRRTALGPERKRVIERALALYDVDTLMLAIDGCAGSAWHAGENDRGREYTDLALILRDEAHVERFADEGEKLHERAARAAKLQQTVVPMVAQPDDPVKVAEQRAALRRFAAQRAGRAVPHG